MTIEVGQRTIAMWSVELPNGNWLCHLARTDDEGKFALSYRFRWYRDELVGRESEDVRKFYGGTLTSTERKAVEKMRAIFDELRAASGGRGWELLRGQRSEQEFLDLLATMPGIHVGQPEAVPA